MARPSEQNQPVSTTVRNNAPVRQALPTIATFMPVVVLAGALAAFVVLAARLQRERL
jgi:hypothetical protein